MNTYLVTYDLNRPGQNYDNVVTRIKTSNNWAKIATTTFIIVSPQSAVQVRDYLMEVMDANDEIFVGLISAPAAWSGLNNEVSNWLRNNLK